MCCVWDEDMSVCAIAASIGGVIPVKKKGQKSPKKRQW